jgi:hypothetical protein
MKHLEALRVLLWIFQRIVKELKKEQEVRALVVGLALMGTIVRTLKIIGKRMPLVQINSIMETLDLINSWKNRTKSKSTF